VGRSGGYADGWDDPEPRAGYIDLTKVAENPVRTIFRATDRGTRLPVTITVCQTQLDEASRAKFVNDCSAISRLGVRPDVLAPIDFGFDPDGHPYVVTEEVTGVTLAHEIREGLLDWRNAIAIGARMAEALAASHRRGVVHGDVAPIRIRRDKTGRPKLEGLAIGRIECDLRMRLARSLLALQHLAPEVLRGAPASGAADVYSLASTTFTLAAGTAPYAPRDDEHPEAWIARIESERPDLRANGIPASLVPVLEAALATNPAARPKSVAALGQQLRAVGDGRAVPSAAAAQAQAAARVQQRRRKRDPGRGPRSVALLAGIIGLCTTAYVIAQSSDESEPAAAAPTTVAAESLVGQAPGFVVGSPLGDDTLTQIGQNLLPRAGTTAPSTVLTAVTLVDPVNDGSVLAFAVGPPDARATIPFRGPTDCAARTQRLAGQPVCTTRLEDGSTMLRWGGTDVWLGVFSEQRPELGAAAMEALVTANLAGD
jgi:hypothetical protein